MSKQKDVLVALLDGPTKQNDLYLNYIKNPNTCQTTLEDLKSKGLIKQDNEDWKRGQVKFFSLTDKGKEKALKILTRRIQQSASIIRDEFQTLEKLGKTLLSSSSQVVEADDAAQKDAWNRMIKEPFRNQHFIQDQAQFRLPLHDAFRSMHGLLTQLQRHCNQSNQYVTVITDGVDPATIPKRLLEGINFNRLRFLSNIGNLQEVKVCWTPNASVSVVNDILLT
jgi:DNA-binding PadR family transcriptional regulator